MSNTSTASVKNFIQNFGSIFKSTVSRFPVTVGLLVIAFVLTCFEVYDKLDCEDEIKVFLFFFTLTGAVLNVALVLWGDNCKSLRTKYIVFAVANIILLWYSVFVVLTSFEYNNHFATMVMPGLLAVILMIGLSVFCLPFFRCKNDLPFYNFSLQAITAILISALAVGILCGAISLLFTAIQHLFDIDRGSRLLTVINLAFVMLAFPVLVMMQLPKNEQLVDETECESNKFINALVRYLFIPLLALLVVQIVNFRRACRMDKDGKMPEEKTEEEIKQQAIKEKEEELKRKAVEEYLASRKRIERAEKENKSKK